LTPIGVESAAVAVLSFAWPAPEVAGALSAAGDSSA